MCKMDIEFHFNLALNVAGSTNVLNELLFAAITHVQLVMIECLSPTQERVLAVWNVPEIKS